MDSRLAVAVTLAVALVLPGAALAAPIDVTNTGDEKTGGNGCSLREAVLAANHNDKGPGIDCAKGSGADTIRLKAATYKVTIGGGDDLGLLGDFDTTESLTIVGVSRIKSIVDGNGFDRVLDQQSGSLTLRDLTVRKGHAPNGI